MMVFLSTNTFSLHSQTHVYFSKTPNHKVLISTNQPSTSFPKFQSITACNPIKISQSSTPTTLITHLLSAHKIIPTFLTKNAVKLLIGSLILVGSLSCKPVRAVPVENGVNLEEKETQKENVEDEEMYVKLVEQEPRNVEALKVLVTVKMRLGKTKEAVKYVERLVGIEPQEVEWRLLQALCYEMLGNLSKAKKLFHEILIKRPLLLRALHGLAMVMHKNNEGAAVFDMLNRALELAIRDKRVTEERNIKILIAQMHLVKGNFDEALNKYGDLIKENPRDFRPYLCQGIIYSLLDKRKEADEQFEIYRNLVPEEFPERGFLEDVVLAAKTESREQLEKEFNIQSSYKR